MKRFLFLLTFVMVSFSPSLWAKTQPQKINPTIQTNSTNPTFQPFTGKIVGNRVRLRLAPSLEGHIIQELNKGDIFAIVSENQDYYAVAPAKNTKAYIFRTHVLDNQVEGERVNVRLEPNLDSPILGQLNSGDQIKINMNEPKSKWFEIELPKDVRFWIAKDYVEKVGPVEYAEKYQERVNEAKQLLATANLISQAEFRKSFQEIDLNRVTRNFERVLSNYTDLEDIHLQAKSSIQSLQKDYCDKKIAFLESKAGKADLEVQSLNAKLTNLKVNDYEGMPFAANESPFKDILSVSNATDKMKVWQPLEYALYQNWAVQNELQEASLQDFYQEELLSSKPLSGIVESFDKMVKNKPGDYMLKLDDDSTVYLYSTHVNLNDYIGKRVHLKAKQRDSHHFAFPAFYVLGIQE